jgi:amidohydrolase
MYTKKIAGRASAFLAVVFMLAVSVPSAAQVTSKAGSKPSESEEAIERAQSLQKYVVTLRHEFHQHPEIRWTEAWTLGRIKQEIQNILEGKATGGPTGAIPSPEEYFAASRLVNENLKRPTVEVKVGKGGIWVDITYDAKFDRLLFRADIDALPVQEAVKSVFASTIDKRMHACGHDTHVAMMLGFVRLAVNQNFTSKHNLRLVFQRAEENPAFGTKNGGQTLVEDDHVLEGVSKVYGLHIWVDKNTGQPGVFGSYPGGMMANNDQFFIEATATGGHGAQPEDRVNPIDMLSAFDYLYMGFALRYPGLGPFQPAASSKVADAAGNIEQANIRPSTAKETYSFRTYLMPSERKQVTIKLKELAAGVGELYRKVYDDPKASMTLNFVEGYPVTANSPSEVGRVAQTLKGWGFKYNEVRTTGSEDFSYYLLQRPGAYFTLGAWREGSGGHHSATFNPDESVLWQGVALWLLLATN